MTDLDLKSMRITKPYCEWDALDHAISARQHKVIESTLEQRNADLSDADVSGATERADRIRKFIHEGPRKKIRTVQYWAGKKFVETSLA